ncbi:MAG: DNA-directed RNA polymerase subunit omega [Nanoarchaeota archaeon]|nr:DNA-directed RNA polymerase subunit omega [Nanoarchaeota archaeon]
MSKVKNDIMKLNKFERTRLFSARAAEIAAGAKPLLDLEKEGLSMSLSRDYVKIAQREFELDLLDLELYSE